MPQTADFSSRYATRVIGGSSYEPSKTASSGSYMRRIGRNAPGGVGSQFARSAGAEGSCSYSTMVSDPSSAWTSPGVRSPIEQRPIGLATRKNSGRSYMVTDQNAPTGGVDSKRSR